MLKDANRRCDQPDPSVPGSRAAGLLPLRGSGLYCAFRNRETASVLVNTRPCMWDTPRRDESFVRGCRKATVKAQRQEGDSKERRGMV